MDEAAAPPAGAGRAEVSRASPEAEAEAEGEGGPSDRGGKRYLPTFFPRGAAAPLDPPRRKKSFT